MATRTKNVTPKNDKAPKAPKTDKATKAAPSASASALGLQEVDPNQVELVRAGSGDGRFTPLFDALKANPSKAFSLPVPEGVDQKVYSNQVRYSISERVRTELKRTMAVRRSRDGKTVVVQLTELRVGRR